MWFISSNVTLLNTFQRKMHIYIRYFIRMLCVGERKDFYKFFTEERGRNATLLLTRLHLFSNLLLRSSLSLWPGLFGQRMSWSWPKMQQSFRERPGTNASRDFAVPLPSVELCFSFARFTILYLLTITCPTRFLNIHQEFRENCVPSILRNIHSIFYHVDDISTKIFE